jgi:hypothetical protein
LFRRLQLGVEDRNAVEALSQSIVDGLMETPVSVRRSASEAGADSLAESAARLFNLVREDR